MRQINFAGNHGFGKRQLSAVIKTSATNMLSFLTGGDVYDPDRVAQDQRTAAALLPQQGLCRRQRHIGKGRIRSSDQGLYADASRSTKARSIISATVSVACNVPGLDRDKLRASPRCAAGAVFDGNALDKTTEAARDRDGKARLSLCPGDPSPHSRCRRATYRRRLRDRTGASHLCRAHRDPRQHAHPRLRDPARIRYRRRRRLQQDADRSRRTAA